MPGFQHLAAAARARSTGVRGLSGLDTRRETWYGIAVDIVSAPPFTRALAEHLIRVSRSYARWTGRELIETSWSERELADRLFEAPFVLLSHGTQADPVLNYGNRKALTLWESTWERFTCTPSRLTAEPMVRDDRARLLAEVTSRGFIDDYRGVRISLAGRRFFIERAIVWSIVDEEDRYRGQAASFEQWRYLD